MTRSELPAPTRSLVRLWSVMHREENYSNPAQTNSELSSHLHLGTNTGSLETLALVLVLNKTRGTWMLHRSSTTQHVLFLESQLTWIGLRQTSHAFYTLTSTDRKGPPHRMVDNPTQAFIDSCICHNRPHNRLFYSTANKWIYKNAAESQAFLQSDVQGDLWSIQTTVGVCSHQSVLTLSTAWLRNHPAREQRTDPIWNQWKRKSS